MSTSTDNTQVNAAQVSDPAVAEYYAGRAPVEEHAMRADFARAHQLEQTYQRDYAEEHEQKHWDANAIDDRWHGHEDPEIAARWDYLTDAMDDWQRSPDVMRRMHENIEFNAAQGFDMVEPHQWRSQQQARELTGNGAWETETARPATTSMNAFATAAAAEQGHERDGAER